MTEWFEEWFGETYLHLYPHRDEADAARLLATLREVIPWRPGLRVLDVACGAGRHAQALEGIGASPIGLDLSWTLLTRAREVTRAPLIRADMRWLPIRPGSMDLTLNLFTSFGYFDSDSEHDDALRQMIDTLRMGGWFAIDFLNDRFVQDTLVPRQESELGGHRVQITRHITADGRFVVKNIHTDDEQHFQERVRLFSAEQLEHMMTEHGLTVHYRYGAYDGASLGAGSSRVILVGQRT